MVTAHSARLHLLPAQFPRQLLPGVTVLSGQCSTTIIIILVITLVILVIITFAIIVICYAGSQSSVLYHISYHHRHTSNLRSNPES